MRFPWASVSGRLACGLVLAVPVAAQDDAPLSTAIAPFRNFESGPTEAMVLSADGRTLYVLNTPDARVEVFATLPEAAPGPRLRGGGPQQHGGGGASGAPQPLGSGHAVVGGGGGSPIPTPLGAPAGAGQVPRLTWTGSIFTGLEPVSMLLHPGDPNVLFVSNHVSDTVSVVDLSLGAVVATIDVGDEPAGLAVAAGKLFVAAARTPQTPLLPGQTSPGPYDQHVVVVAEAAPPYGLLGHVPLVAVKPRDVVAVGDTVYVIPLASGNRTVILDEKKAFDNGLLQDLPDATEAPFAVNPILQRPEFHLPPYVRGWFVPVTGRIVFDSEWPGLVPQLPDRDIIPIDADTLAVDEGGITTGVGTVLFDLEVNPVTGELWVAATEARNRERFEHVVRGRAIDNRVVIAAPGGAVTSVLTLAPPFTPREHAQPAHLAFSSGPAGDFAYVAALGTASIVVLDAATGAFLQEIDTGEIPGGLVADQARGLLYVFCRGDKTIRAYDIAGGHAPVGDVATLPYDPEPRSVSVGRRHLYDARDTTGHGNRNMSCASCHVFGHYDHEAWDLGAPEGSFSYYFPDALQEAGSFPGEIVVAPWIPIINPLKGPMVTQSLRGLIDPDTKDDTLLHWRGDRRTVHQFRTAFVGLNGGSGISRVDMQELATFLRSLRYAPNPFQPRDRDYVGQPADGLVKFGMDPAQDGTPYAANLSNIFCATCHKGDLLGKTDFTGARPVASAGSFNQLFQTAQLRMIYEKDFRDITGFGALHDGAVDGVRGFMDFVVPLLGHPTFPGFNTQDKDDVATFVKHWDSGLSPLVGAQFTLDGDTVGDLDAWLDLAEAEAQPPRSNVDVIVKGVRLLEDGTLLPPRGALFTQQGGTGPWGYQFDTGSFVSRSVLVAVGASGLVHFTFTCVPPGTGVRLGLDRDEDGVWDDTERAAGTSPVRADTDGDGYPDGAEAALGGDPLAWDASLPDGTAPAISGVRALELFNKTATINLVTDEPARVAVDTGLGPGVYTLGHFEVPGWRRVHDVALEGLVPGAEIFYRVTATDPSGNAAVHEDSFTAFPPYHHLQDMTLEVSGTGPYTAVATVLVHDQDEQPVPDMNVHAFWAGDIGGQPWEVDARTDATGVATFTLGSWTPAGPTTVAFSPQCVGSRLRTDPDFVGLGGDWPTFFYDNTRNDVHYRAVTLP